MAEEVEWWEFDAAEDLIDAVVGDVSFIIESALDARGQALVAFPGGSTPKPILEKLAQCNIRWKNVTIIPTDDRLVAVDNPLSNVAMIAKMFCRLQAMPQIISSPEAPQMRGWRTCTGRPIWSGWGWVPTATPRPFFRVLIWKTHWMQERTCAPSVLPLILCRRKPRSIALRLLAPRLLRPGPQCW
jgi:hypothetical protein